MKSKFRRRHNTAKLL